MNFTNLIFYLTFLFGKNFMRIYLRAVFVIKKIKSCCDMKIIRTLYTSDILFFNMDFESNYINRHKFGEILFQKNKLKLMLI